MPICERCASEYLILAKSAREEGHDDIADFFEDKARKMERTQYSPKRSRRETHK